MLLTVLRRWCRCCSYSVWLYGLYTTGASCFLKVFPCSLSSCFFILFSIVINSLGEEGAGLCASRAFVCLFCTCQFLSFVSSSCCRGLAALCDCGTPWTFLLTVLFGPVSKHVSVTTHHHLFLNAYAEIQRIT